VCYDLELGGNGLELTPAGVVGRRHERACGLDGKEEQMTTEERLETVERELVQAKRRVRRLVMVGTLALAWYNYSGGSP
jgi:hypothetical protein